MPSRPENAKRTPIKHLPVGGEVFPTKVDEQELKRRAKLEAKAARFLEHYNAGRTDAAVSVIIGSPGKRGPARWDLERAALLRILNRPGWKKVPRYAIVTYLERALNGHKHTGGKRWDGEVEREERYRANGRGKPGRPCDPDSRRGRQRAKAEPPLKSDAEIYGHALRVIRGSMDAEALDYMTRAVLRNFTIGKLQQEGYELTDAVAKAVADLHPEATPAEAQRMRKTVAQRIRRALRTRLGETAREQRRAMSRITGGYLGPESYARDWHKGRSGRVTVHGKAQHKSKKFLEEMRPKTCALRVRSLRRAGPGGLLTQKGWHSMKRTTIRKRLETQPVATIDLSETGYPSFKVMLTLPLSGPAHPDLTGDAKAQRRVAWALLRELYG